MQEALQALEHGGVGTRRVVGQGEGPEELRGSAVENERAGEVGDVDVQGAEPEPPRKGRRHKGSGRRAGVEEEFEGGGGVLVHQGEHVLGARVDFVDQFVDRREGAVIRREGFVYRQIVHEPLCVEVPFAIRVRGVLRVQQERKGKNLQPTIGGHLQRTDRRAKVQRGGHFHGTRVLLDDHVPGIQVLQSDGGRKGPWVGKGDNVSFLRGRSGHEA